MAFNMSWAPLNVKWQKAVRPASQPVNSSEARKNESNCLFVETLNVACRAMPCPTSVAAPTAAVSQVLYLLFILNCFSFWFSFSPSASPFFIYSSLTCYFCWKIHLTFCCKVKHEGCIEKGNLTRTLVVVVVVVIICILACCMSLSATWRVDICN